MVISPAVVIIAAHNEERVIGRCLSALADAIVAGVRVVVVCNGCNDATYTLASRHAGVEVVDIPIPSKTLALREGDRYADELQSAGLLEPDASRIYLDADVVMTSRAITDIVCALDRGPELATRPPVRHDTTRATFIVRRWYRVRAQISSFDHVLWGAGCYALSAHGRRRFDEFPEVVSDDLFIDMLFGPAEKRTTPTDQVTVTTPRNLKYLLLILQRTYRTEDELAEHVGSASHTAEASKTKRNHLRDLFIIATRHPFQLVDLVLYVCVIGTARIRAARDDKRRVWERDDSSRN
ncbi:glycosyltransferase [Ornithinicoccus hortensis]|uniref:Glycosyl transferase family 2 n=1 Tax=Ornithinicoccus hortensis TaxID=82346 RepID=A0A542YLL8_9MICO|nr:glycosyltransferase [Ornithinicoccus hortensis]TQL48978.1 glycosyl transferase family 2 [Ornithinicoccus hortensis]